MTTGETNNNRAKNLSFVIKTNGEIVPTTPVGSEFSPDQIREYVAGPFELFCRTHDGFFLFHNQEGKVRGLPRNGFATAMYLMPTRRNEAFLGIVFVAHPDHIAADLKAK